MRTSINGKEAPWPEDVQRIWRERVGDQREQVDREVGVTIVSANYFTPRPYVDKYNTGSRDTGFTYVARALPAGRPQVCYCNWIEDKR